MEKIKNKKMLIGVVIAVLLIGVVGYFIYDNNRRNEIKDKMNIIFTETKEVEYGTKDFDVKKELIKDVENAEIKDFSKLDTSKIGEQTLAFTLIKKDVEKIMEYKIKVVDTKAPVIELENETKELVVNEEYDFMSNIKEVKDEVDGAIELNKDALELNKKATEEYGKLDKDKVNDDTKIADKSLKDFLIEDVEGKEEKVLYLKNCYYVDGSVDIATVGEYKITVVAVDKNGIKTIKEFSVTVKEKEVEKPVNNSNGSVSSNGNGGVGGGSSTSGGGSSYVGSKQDIINTAIAQLGKPYQLGATGPDAFDCSGFIWYAYSQNGWSIPRYPESGGTRISYDQVQAGDIYYLPDNGQGGSHVGLAINKTTWIEASNANVHYVGGNPSQNPSVIFIRY